MKSFYWRFSPFETAAEKSPKTPDAQKIRKPGFPKKFVSPKKRLKAVHARTLFFKNPPPDRAARGAMRPDKPKNFGLSGSADFVGRRFKAPRCPAQATAGTRSPPSPFKKGDSVARSGGGFFQKSVGQRRSSARATAEKRRFSAKAAFKNKKFGLTGSIAPNCAKPLSARKRDKF